MAIVVTGATGHLGRLVVAELLERGADPAEIVAGGRDLDKVKDVAERGVRTARLDYDDPATFDDVLTAGDTLLLVSGSEPGGRVPQHQRVIDAARRAGVGRIVYTSAPRADDTPLVLAPEHLATEQAIAASGLPATILRNGWYTENYEQAARQARDTGVVASSTGDGRVASATRADYAAAAAAVLTSDGHEGEVYELSGDTAWDFDELAATLSELLGREVVHQRLTTDEHVALLKGFGLDDVTARFVAALDANIADGALDLTTGDLSRLAGRPTTPLLEGQRPLV
jgi:NAD(P)H dehydrogenase (quinone)